MENKDKRKDEIHAKFYSNSIRRFSLKKKSSFEELKNLLKTFGEHHNRFLILRPDNNQWVSVFDERSFQGMLQTLNPFKNAIHRPLKIKPAKCNISEFFSEQKFFNFLESIDTQSTDLDESQYSALIGIYGYPIKHIVQDLGINMFLILLKKIFIPKKNESNCKRINLQHYISRMTTPDCENKTKKEIKEIFTAELEKLKEIGFEDEEKNLKLLVKFGCLEKTVQELIKNS